MSRQTLFADVLLPLAVPNLYTYRVPFELNERIVPGIRVLVQFGKSRFYSALVKNVHETPPGYTAKYIEEILDPAPIVHATQFTFWDWISSYYLCYTGEVMNAALPAGLKLNSETKIVLNTDLDENEKTEIRKHLNDNEYLLVEALETRNVLSYQEAAQITDMKNPQPVIRQLLAKKIVLLFEEVKERYKPKMMVYVRLADELLEEDKLRAVFEQLEKKAFKQLEALMFYLKEVKRDENSGDYKWIKKNLLAKHVDAAAVNALVKKNIFYQQEFETGRLEQDGGELVLQKKLSAGQTKAFEQIETSFKEHEVCLLHGVTGSGKTEIYAALIEETLKRGRQALYLVPEIALTTQLISRIKRYFGDQVGVYHSRFSDNERVEVWNAVLGGNAGKERFNQSKYKVVLGARSALFLPFDDLGLIIVDEEHDSSYKQQDPAPRYHARDAAIYLGKLHKANVLLGTATPCLESYYNATQNKYGLVELNERFGGSVLPLIQVIDNRQEGKKKAEENIISQQLFEEIRKTLSQKEQIILFQNRRGFAPYTECYTCGHVPCCVQCDVSLIYHKATQKLTCHYCGYTTDPPRACNACGSTDLRYRGFGTQKIEEEIELLLPDVKTRRMDIDSTRSKHAYKQIIEEFDAGDIDILTGTQMVTKGLDFDNVGMVGVVQADHLLSYPDFRSYERAFQLMTQVSGRAGRKEKRGKVFIQTTQPDHPVIGWVQKHSYSEMYTALLAERKEFLYPPFTRLFNFTFICKDYDLLNEAAESFGKELRSVFAHRVLGPEFPLVSRIKNEFYKQILLKTERDYAVSKIREHLQRSIFDFRSNKIFSKVRLKIDVDPY